MLSSRLHLPVPWQIRQINKINVAAKGQINLDSCLSIFIRLHLLLHAQLAVLIPDSNIS